MISLSTRVVKQLLRVAVRDRLDSNHSVAVQRRAFSAGTWGLGIPRGTEVRALDDERVRGEWVTPGAPSDAALLYLHGGAFCLGSPRTHRALVARLAAAAGARCLSLDYRLAPESPFPAALDDALAAYALLRREGFATTRIAVAGDSAGGGLAVSLMVALRDRGAPLPAAAALLSPWVDLALTGESTRTRAALDCVLTPAWLRRMASCYGVANDLSAPALSPLRADLAGLPPLFIAVGGDEILLDDATRLAAAARAAGGVVRLEVYSGLFHVFPMLAPIVPEARIAIIAAGDFLQEHLRTPTPRAAIER